MIELKKIGDFDSLLSNYEKKQIILCHSSREVSEYLTSLNVRYGMGLDKIPNYVIDREGNLFQLLDDYKFSNFFPSETINKKSIIISLENLGWLEKKPLSTDYINWKGNIYNGVVYEKKWRDYFYWQPYTDIQIQNTALLCMELINKFGIKKQVIGHNTKVDYVEHFEGIVCRSNFSTRYTDLNPSFNFIKLENYIEDEQFAQ